MTVYCYEHSIVNFCTWSQFGTRLGCYRGPSSICVEFSHVACGIHIEFRNEFSLTIDAFR